MRDYTIEDFPKSLRECENGKNCQECNIMEICRNQTERFHGLIADYIELKQKEIAELKKEIADLKKQISEYDLNGQIRARDEALKRRKARNVLLEEENEKLKKQIAETYTAEQAQKDFLRYSEDNSHKRLYMQIADLEKLQEWAKSHPEPPKVTNGDKFKEVFGRSYEINGFKDDPWWKYEYVQPSDK